MYLGVFRCRTGTAAVEVAWEAPAKTSLTLSSLSSEDRSIACVAAAGSAAGAVAGVSAAEEGGGPPVGTKATGRGRLWRRVVWVVGSICVPHIGRKQLAHRIQKGKKKKRKPIK